MSWMVARETPIVIFKREFRPSEIGLGLDELKNANWISELEKYYEASHRGLSKAIYLTALAAISSALPPIPYRGAPIRSKINLMLRGQPGGGKGFLMYIVEQLCPKVKLLGATTSAALLGGTDKFGNWIPGKAYHAQYGVLLIRELFQSLRSGEWYADIANDLNEIAEYPHEVTKTNLTANIKDPDKVMIEYPGVTFPDRGSTVNTFAYKAPCAIIAGVPEISLYDLLMRLNEGLLSRFIEIPIGYDRTEAKGALQNFWRNVMPVGQEDSAILEESDLAIEQRFRRCFFMLYTSNIGMWYDLKKVEPIREIILPEKIRNLFEEESMRALERSFNTVEQQFKMTDDLASVRPPILFRECGDLLRLACCDAVSRRFAGTEIRPGYIRIDERAANTVIPFLNMISETAITNMIEARKIKKLAATVRPSLMGVAYAIIESSGHHGKPVNEYYSILEKNFSFSHKKAERQLQKMISGDLVEEKSGILYATPVTRISRSVRW